MIAIKRIQITWLQVKFSSIYLRLSIFRYPFSPLRRKVHPLEIDVQLTQSATYLIATQKIFLHILVLYSIHRIVLK